MNWLLVAIITLSPGVSVTYSTHKTLEQCEAKLWESKGEANCYRLK